MIVIDSSAVLAIYLQESDASNFADAIEAAGVVKMAAPTYIETFMAALSKRGELALEEIDMIIRASGIELLPFGADSAHMAVKAFRRFGKGQGHKAQLNFGDCISYAVSKCEAMPLLFKGDDFRHTDVECAI